MRVTQGRCARFAAFAATRACETDRDLSSSPGRTTLHERLWPGRRGRLAWCAGAEGSGWEIQSGSVESSPRTRCARRRAPTGGRRRALCRAGAPRGPFGLRSPTGPRCQRAPIGGPGGTDTHAERARTGAGDAHGARCTASNRRGVPGPAGPRREGGLPAPAWAACAAQVRRCPRFWWITDACVMKATMRIVRWHAGHASVSTSKRCWSRAAHRRVTSGGASRGTATIAGGPSAAAGGPSPACHWGSWPTSRSTRGDMAFVGDVRGDSC